MEEGKDAPDPSLSLPSAFDAPAPVLEAPDFPDPSTSSKYFQLMKDFRFSTCDFGDSFPQIDAEADSSSPLDTARIQTEIRSISKNSPCESAASIFVSMDSSCMQHLRALISGPEDTPYAHGLYLFDVALTCNYPQLPPIVRIATNGNGKVRFNPNLYSDGFVCLSIINTWEASPEEMWLPATSSLLQVFLSIQSLVMDNSILQKEPNYETFLVSDPGNLVYSAVVRYNNVKYAMRKMVEHPPQQFKEVVWRHFALKREEVVKTCEKWVEEGEAGLDFGNVDFLAMDHNTLTISKFQKKGYHNCLSKQVERLKSVFAALPPL